MYVKNMVCKFQVRHTVTKQSINADGGVTHAHILEITGPILPSHCQTLISLFHKTQTADFGMVFNTHEPTVPLNILPSMVNKNCDKNVSKDTEKNVLASVDNIGISSGGVGEDNSDSGTILDSIKENNDSEANGQDKDDVRNKLTVNENKKVEEENNVLEMRKHFKNEKISDKISAIKEIVCTPQGFTWNS